LLFDPLGAALASGAETRAPTAAKAAPARAARFTPEPRAGIVERNDMDQILSWRVSARLL
jgi:hypothetical protein